jgi:hypothetical protein
MAATLPDFHKVLSIAGADMEESDEEEEGSMWK